MTERARETLHLKLAVETFKKSVGFDAYSQVEIVVSGCAPKYREVQSRFDDSGIGYPTTSSFYER